MPRLYKRPNSPFWYAEITVDGKPKRISTGVSCNPRLRKAALEAAEAKERELAAKSGLTLEDAVRKFLMRCEGRLRASSVDTYSRVLVNVIITRPDACLRDITPKWLRTYVQDRKDNVSDVQVRRELDVLSILMEMAVEEGWDDGSIEFNPVKVISKRTLKRPKPRPRWLKPEEVKALLDAAPNDFWKAYLTLLLETGMRREELLGLRWDEVDLDKGVINLPSVREKTGNGRQIPLTDTALRTLRSVRRAKDVWVFTSPRSGARYHPASLNQTWIRLRQRAGVPHARIHDFRHTFASWTRQLGMARDDRRRVTGHLDEGSHDIYSHTTIEVLKEALNRHSPSTLLAHNTENSRGREVEAEENQ